MAGKEFLESIESNFKQAIKFLNSNKSERALTDDLAEQIMQAIQHGGLHFWVSFFWVAAT